MSEDYMENPVVQAAIQERIAVVRNYKAISDGEPLPLEWDLDDLCPEGLMYIIGPSDRFMVEGSASFNYVRKRNVTARPG